MDWEYLDNVSQTIDDLSKQDSHERLNAIRFMEMMEFEEQRGGKDLKYWIRYSQMVNHV